MKRLFLLLTILFLFSACSLHVKPPKEQNVEELLQGLDESEFETLRTLFQASCKQKKFNAEYSLTCKESYKYESAKIFFLTAFDIVKQDADDEHLMTGYYEASLKGSKVKSKRYQYPIYAVPNDFTKPYLERKDINEDIDATVLCYVDDALDLYFLHVQGSGRVLLDDGSSMKVGYANQNGQPYTSIGKEMIKRGYIDKEDISLQSIRSYFLAHPNQLQEILEINRSYVFFRKSTQGATGALGLELTPYYSVATDLAYIPLGTPLLYKSNNITHLALSQDTGGAIKGAVRADLFFGFEELAKQKAGKMNHYLELWVFKPKERKAHK